MAAASGGLLKLSYGAGAASLTLRERDVVAALPIQALRRGIEEVLWRSEGETVVEQGSSHIFLRGEEETAGAVRWPVGEEGMEEAARAVYSRVFSAVEGLHLYRVWNFVPAINREVGGLEQYQRFNIGRREAYFARFGEDATRQMPAASAVGTDDKALVTVFISGRERPVHIENPDQIPAYRYPAEYGPAPPSFARGTLVRGERRVRGYVAGTASIVGHASVSMGDLNGQIDTAMSNLQAVLGVMGVEGRRTVSAIPAEGMRVYLRKAGDLPQLERALRARFGEGYEPVVLRAEICRSELDVEVELSFCVQAGGS